MNDLSGASGPTKVTKRKNTSKACEECRRRRAKCDGRKPSCGRCSEKHLICRYNLEDDGRQPAPKSYVLLLRRRIDLLERCLRMHGIEVEASIARLTTADDLTSVSKALAVPIVPFANLPADTDIQSTNGVEELSSAFEGALSLDDTVNFDEDGEHHYFGPTSGRLEFLESEVSKTPSSYAGESPARSRRSRVANEMWFGSDLGGDFVSYELREHLEDLYFTWENPWYQMVDRSLYQESEHTNGRYFSPLLLNCVLAMGSRFSDRPEIRTDPNDPKTAGKMFLDKIEGLLHYELKWPTLTTVQSLAILCGVYISNGSDAIGWLYQGMANRLALDMGLNIDPGGLAERDSMSLEEVQLRRRIYWALYCTDKLAASYTGRVCTMLDSQGAVKLPELPSNHIVENPPQRESSPTDTKLLQLQLGLIRICRVLEKIFLTLYAPKPLLTGSKAAPFLQSCLLELRNWLYDLSPTLKIDRNGKHLPQVYTLHMVYHTASILLGKYFLTQHSMPSTSSSSRLTATVFNQDTVDQARVICWKAALEICAVATKYRQVFGSFRQSPITATHCTLSAALILIKGHRDGSAPSMVDGAHIKLCLEVLKELSESWWPANRIHRRIEILAQQKLDVMPERHEPTPAETFSRKDPAGETAAFLGSDIDFETQNLNLSILDANSLVDWDWNASDLAMTDIDYNNMLFPTEELPRDYANFDSLYQMQFSDVWQV